MASKKAVTPAVKYFLKHLERRSEALEKVISAERNSVQDVPFEAIESFFRRIMTQNIFIHTVGMNGRPESTILSKATFSMNRVVRLYYSTSFDDTETGFIRIQPNKAKQLIIVERMHGIRPKPEILYQSHDECHVIRFMTRWLIRRIDWNKTHLKNLDLYKQFQEQERQEEMERLQAIENQKIEEQMAMAADLLKAKVYGGGGAKR
ncbi:MAG: hypothetical protein JXK16_04330 [Thiotrichales bacterium]|nr:hypothetical protein [Thiotrichales bacterium]